MRKRSSYRPRPVRVDAVNWVVTGTRRVADMEDENMVIRMKNRLALEAVLKGHATRQELDEIIAAVNMCKALCNTGLGDDWGAEIDAASEAVLSMCRRGIKHGNRFAFTAQEMAAVKLMMDVHDAQLDRCTVAQMERGLDIVNRAIVTKTATVINLPDEVAA